MSELMNGREFQLWEYHVSHGSLLIRSPAGPDFETSVDIICLGVEYVAVPRFLGQISVAEANKADVKTLEVVLGKDLVSSKVWALEGSSRRFFVVAAALKIQEYHGDIFDSPFSR